MPAAKAAKKSETIEVRLSHEAKTAFMDRCRLEERTASEVIRLFIDGRIDPLATNPRSRSPHWRTAIAAAIGVAIGLGAAAPSLARSSQTSRVVFEQLDRNHDGVLTYDEFRSR